MGDWIMHVDRKYWGGIVETASEILGNWDGIIETGPGFLSI